MIPQFNSAGIIPPYLTHPGGGERSPYQSNIIELCERFGFSPARRTILRGLIGYRQMLCDADFKLGYQLINGSFMEDCEKIRGRPPGDIDIFSYLDMPKKYLENKSLFTSEGMPFLTTKAMSADNKLNYHVDAYLVVSPPGMGISEFFHAFSHFTLLFSHQKVTEIWKGAVSLALDADADNAALQVLDALEQV